jgi:tRNA pseudouridine55 synthase
MNGGLVVDKPSGPTSHDVVARVRRAIGIRRIGHTGTLDPLATGVLLLLIGRATRLAQYLTGDEKAYIAGVRLGSATPTYDAEGRTSGEDRGAAAGQPAGSGVPVTEAGVREALEAFRGTFLQTPPPFSAKKVGGTPAYKLARRQQDVVLSPVEVTVRELTLAGYAEGLATIHVTASSGFYVRSLAHDLGARLGCGGHLETLRRVRTGAFTEEQAVPLSVVEAEGTRALSRAVPMSELVAPLPWVVVSERGATRVLCGQPLDAADLHQAAAGDLSESTGPVRVLDGQGALLAIARYRPGGSLRPVVVLV